MKIKFCFIGLFAFATLVLAAPRDWILKTGKTINGDFVSSGTATLVIKTDGTNCFVKISDLSSNDQALVKNIQKTNNETAWLEAREKFIKEYKPLRVINGELYDFSVLCSLSPDGTSSYAHPIGNYFTAFEGRTVSGKVIQVLDDGLLVEEKLYIDLNGSQVTRIVFLKNYQHQNVVIDGSSISALALPSGRYKYENTAGAEKTILAFDCGRTYDPSSDEFSNKVILTYKQAVAGVGEINPGTGLPDGGSFYKPQEVITPVVESDKYFEMPFTN